MPARIQTPDLRPVGQAPYQLGHVAACFPGLDGAVVPPEVIINLTPGRSQRIRKLFRPGGGQRINIAVVAFTGSEKRDKQNGPTPPGCTRDWNLVGDCSR
ncbi:hypothetical protein RRG08_009776 [Elysia crispata]|uniref:Uncharacterized protein n=1 Tax=Elysia crispata TaxID=231223 RepID=A0AAE0ZQP2_9GAST|nr:hypothetical protein RRG08_009776 [Elysia crispata]